MNRVVLVGRLENTPDLRHTSTGIPVANFSLSVRRSIPNGQGRYERDIFRVVTWRKLAETCCRFLERGRMIAVDGKLQNRIMQGQVGDRRVVVEVHADDVRFLEGARPRSDSDSSYDSDSDYETDSDEAMDEDREMEEAGVTVSEAKDYSYKKPSDNSHETKRSDNGELSEDNSTYLNDSSISADESKDDWLNEEDAGTPIDLES
ncbi:MAG TPA: single-stranded DNA-binding protein [bacterium]